MPDADLTHHKIQQQDLAASRSNITRLFGLLQTACSKISSTLDPEDVIRTVTCEFPKILGAKACLFYNQPDLEKGHSAGYHADLEVIGVNNISALQPLETFLSKRNLFQNTDIRRFEKSDPDLDSKVINFMAGSQVNVILVIPLSYQEGIIGLVVVLDDQERVYDEVEILTVKLLASHSAIAISNAQLFEKAKWAFTEQQALQESGLIIASSLDLDTILRKIAEQIGRLLDATSVYISRFEPTEKKLTVLAEYYSEQAAVLERLSDLNYVYDQSHDFEEIISFFDSGQPSQYNVDDPDLGEIDRAHLKKYGGKNVLEIPLRVGGEFTALIEVWESREKRTFIEGEIRLCQTIALQAAIAIENARLFHEAQQEIALRMQIEEKLKYDAFHDALTDLSNRSVFLDRLQHAIHRRARFSQNFAVLYLDLDKFKRINDTFGHTEGDRLLIQTARRLESSVREIDTVSRFGGDEFLILIEDDLDPKTAFNLADRLQQKLNEPIQIGGHGVIITASIGIAIGSPEYNRPEDYIRNSDIAMFNAKAIGYGRSVIFSTTKGLDAKRRLTLEAELRQAVEDRDFLVYYQPIIDLKTLRIAGFEALLRWRKKDGRIGFPNEFLNVLEETGMLVEVGRLVIHEALQQISKWQTLYPQSPSITISVNISNNQLTHPDFVKMIQNSMDLYPIAPNSLVLEITENILIKDAALVVDILHELQAIGVQINIDDFGTGFSSLSYLRNLPVDAIKVDRVFISSIRDQQDNRTLLNSIVAMAKDLGLSIVSEGIETREQVEITQKIACDYGQGFYFGKGLASADAEKHFQKWRKRFGPL